MAYKHAFNHKNKIKRYSSQFDTIRGEDNKGIIYIWHFKVFEATLNYVRLSPRMILITHRTTISCNNFIYSYHSIFYIQVQMDTFCYINVVSENSNPGTPPWQSYTIHINKSTCQQNIPSFHFGNKEFKWSMFW